jgi:hypothetical protein
LVLKTASRDAEEVIKVSSYIFLGFHQLGQCDCLENLSFPSLALVGDHAPKKDYGPDFGYVLIQSNGLITLDIRCCCVRLVISCKITCSFLGVGKGFLTNVLLLPKIAKKAYGVVIV